MTQTTNLKITHVEQAQKQKEVPINVALGVLDGAVSGTLAVDCSAGGTLVVSEADSKVSIVRLTGTPAAAFTLQVPAVSRNFVVVNATAQTATITAGAGTTADVVAGQTAQCVYTSAGVSTSTPPPQTWTDLMVSGQWAWLPRPLPAGFSADYYSRAAADMACLPPVVFASGLAGIGVGRAKSAAFRTSDGKHHYVGGQSGTTPVIVTNHDVFIESTGRTATATAYPVKTSGNSIACAVGGEGFVFGGSSDASPWTLSASYKLNAGGTWSAIASLPAALIAHAASDIGNGKILISGGMNASGVPVADTRVYTVASNTYASGPALPETRFGHASATISGNRVLIIGGAQDAAETIKLTSCLIYDDAAGTVTATEPLPFALVGPVATTLSDGTVLVTGMRYLDGIGPVSAVLLFNTSSPGWAELPALSDLRGGPSLTAIGTGPYAGFAIVLGGGFGAGGGYGGMRNDFCIYRGMISPLLARKD